MTLPLEILAKFVYLKGSHKGLSIHERSAAAGLHRYWPRVHRSGHCGHDLDMAALEELPEDLGRTS